MSAAAAALDPGMNGWCTVELACHIVGRTAGGLGDATKQGIVSGCAVCVCASVHTCVRVRGLVAR